MGEKPNTTIGNLIREAMRKGEVITDAKAAERLGLSDFAVGQGIKLMDPSEIAELEKDGEQSVVVCVLAGTPTPYTDNETGVCIECGRAVVYRPIFTPDQVKVCIECAFGGKED